MDSFHRCNPYPRSVQTHYVMMQAYSNVHYFHLMAGFTLSFRNFQYDSVYFKFLLQEICQYDTVHIL